MGGALDQGTHGWWWRQWLKEAAAAVQGTGDGSAGAAVTQGTGDSDGWCQQLQRRRLRTQTGAAAQGSRTAGEGRR